MKERFNAVVAASQRRLAVQMIFPDLQAELEFSMRQLLSSFAFQVTGCRNQQYNSISDSD